MMKKLVFALIIFTIPFISKAQMGGRMDVEAYKVSWITQKLDLSAEDAKIFWPIYNEYVKEQAMLRRDRQKNLISFRKITEIDELSDTEIQALITSELIFKQRDLNIEKKYYARFQKALPIKTLAKFLRAQETFKKELLNKFRDGGGGQRRMQD